MSLVNSSTSQKEIEKVWNSFLSGSKEIDSFLSICKIVKDQLGQWKEILHKKKFQQVLIESIEQFFTKVEIKGKKLVSCLVSMLRILQYLLIKKKLSSDLRPGFIEKTFICFEQVFSREDDDKYKAKALFWILAIVEASVKTSLSSATEDILYPKLNETIELIVKSSSPVWKLKMKFSIYSDVPVKKTKQSDVTLMLLELYKAYLEKSHRNFNPREFISFFINNVKNCIELNEFKNCEVECKKFETILNIARVMNGKEKNFLSEFLARFGEKLKQIFVLCVSVYSFLEFDEDVCVETQELFDSLFIVLKTGCDETNTTILNIPMVIFQLLFNTVIPSQSTHYSESFIVYLKILSLKFVWSFYFEFRSSKLNLFDIMIPQLLFSSAFFIHNSPELSEIWEKIWKKISENFSRKTAKMIFEELERNGKNLAYLQKFSDWLEVIKEKSQNAYDILAERGLYKEIVLVLGKVKEPDTEFQLIMMIEKAFALENSKKINLLSLAKLVFEIFSKRNSMESLQVFEILIKEILCLCNLKIFDVYIQFLKTLKDDQVILSALKSIERAFEKKIFSEFLEIEKNSNRELFNAIVILTPSEYEKDQVIIDVWKSLLSCLFLLSPQKNFGLTESTGLNILPLLKNLRKFPDQQQQIFNEILDQLLQTLLNEKRTLIRNPAFIPLLIEILCVDYYNLQEKYKSLMKSLKVFKINLNLISTHYFFSVFFHYLMKTTDYFLLEAYQDLCYHLISNQFTIYDLENWVSLFSAWPAKHAKIELLKLLMYGIKKREIDEQALQYFYFIPNSQIISDYSASNIIFAKELCILACIYIENIERSNIITIKCNKINIVINLTKSSLFVKINEKFIQVDARFMNNCWTCICVNISSKKKLSLNIIKKANVYIDGKYHYEKFNDLNFKLANFNKIEKVCLGSQMNSGKDEENFVGKISFLGLLKKNLDQETISEICGLGVGLCMKEIENVLIKGGKDFNEYALLDATGEHFNRVCVDVLRVNSVPALNSIKVFGIRRLLLEIRKSIRNDEVLQEYFEFIKTLVYHDKYLKNPMFKEDTVRLLSRIIKKSSLTEESCYIITDIMGKYTDRNKIILDIIISDDSLYNSFKTNMQLLSFILDSYKYFYHPSQSNLYIFCTLIKHLPKTEFSNIFQDYIYNEDHQQIKLFLSPALHKFDIEKQYELIEKIIYCLKDFDYNFTKPTQFLAVLLEMIDSVNPLYLQKIIIEAIFYKEINEIELVENIFEVIKETMEINLNLDFIQFLLSKGFDSQSLLKDHRYYFVDTVLARLYSITCKEGKKLVVDKLKENEGKLAEAVFKRLAYPDWLEKYTHVKEMDKEVYELFEYLFEVGQKTGDFSHVQAYFISSDKVSIYQYLVERYCYDVNVNFLLEIFVSIQNQLKKNEEVLIHIYKKLKNSDEFRVLIQDSILNLNIFEYAKTNKGLNTKPLIVNYLNFLLLGLDCPSGANNFKYLKVFLKHKMVSFFNINDPEEEISKVPLSVYLFIELLKKVVNGSLMLTNDLVYYIKAAKIKKKLKILNTKFLQSLESLFKEDALIEPNADLMKNVKVNNAQEAHRVFLSVLNECTEEVIQAKSTELTESIQLYSIVFQKFSSQVTEASVSGDFSSHIPYARKQFIDQIKKYTEESHNTQLFSNISDTFSRDLFKIEQDYKIFKKRLVNLKYILESDQPKSITVRQIYDKFYRWSTVKPLKCQQETINELKLNKIYSGVTPLIENKDVFFNVDKTPESPNTTGISENSGFSGFVMSREPSSGLPTIRSNNSSQFSTPCERIKVQGSIFGRINISENFFELIFEGQIKSDGPDFKGSLSFSRMKQSKRRVWYPSEFSEVYFKRFIHRETALEFILCSGKSYFLNFFKKKTRNEVVKRIKSWSGSCKIKYKEIDVDNYTSAWKKGEISNFEYLMIINQYASRSMNDLSQYPVFPWIITNYTLNEFAYDGDGDDLRNLKYFRNLRLPVGAQSEASQKILSKKFNSWKEETMQPYHHGSHYSNCGIIVHFLLRLEPYTTQAKDLQGGSFDVADRLFISLKLAWDSCNMGIGGDVKELIPELFYQPYLFTSYNNACFGKTCDGYSIIDVEKPDWAHSNWDFIIKNRNSLESSCVSKELHNWIDLVFGFKQSGKYAESSFNVFTSATYKAKYKEFCREHDDCENIAMTEQVYHFGQVPGCLFSKKSHPVREDFVKNFKFFSFFYKNSDGDLELKPTSSKPTWNGKINFMFMHSEHIYLIKTADKETKLCKVVLKDSHDVSGIFTEYQMQNFFPVPESIFTYNNKNFSFNQFSFTWSSNNFALFSNKYLIAGLDQSNTIKIFDFKGKLNQYLSFHTMPVICVTCSSDKIFSAGFDGKIKSWKLDSKDFFNESLSFHGHSSPIIALKVLDSYQVLVSASYENLILTHDTKNSTCLNKLELTVRCIEVNEIGIIALGCESSFEYFGVNLDKISNFRVNGPVKSLKLSECGNFCIGGFEDSIEVFDIFNYEKKKVYQGLRAFQVEIHSHENFVYFVGQDENVSLRMLRIVSRRQLEQQTKLMNELI